MSLVTVAEVEKQSGEQFDDDTYNFVETIIPQTQGDMESVLGRALSVRPIIGEIHELPIERTFIYLRSTPVVSVQSITVNGFHLQPARYFAQPMGITLYGNVYGMAPVGANIAAWLSPVATFVTDYTGGIDVSSDPKFQVLKDVMIRAILRQVTAEREGDSGRAGYISMKVEDFTWRKSEGVVAGEAGFLPNSSSYGWFTPADMRLILRLKRRTAVS